MRAHLVAVACASRAAVACSTAVARRDGNGRLVPLPRKP
jgi:hypothetical protein